MNFAAYIVDLFQVMLLVGDQQLGDHGVEQRPLFSTPFGDLTLLFVQGTEDGYTLADIEFELLLGFML